MAFDLFTQSLTKIPSIFISSLSHYFNLLTSIETEERGFHMRMLKLFTFLACFIAISFLIQGYFNHNHEKSKAKNSIVKSHQTDLEFKKLEVDEELNSPNDEKTVYLTFDDGPTSATTHILNTLHEFNAKATFFMLEPSMKEFPEAVHKIVEEGHAVGLHGVTHNKALFYKSEKSALNEMTTAQATLEQITGIKTNLIRTPYGSVPYLTESYRKVLDRHGFKLWDWNVDSNDWSLSGKKYVNTVIRQIEKLIDAGETPIILMHDKENTANQLYNLLTYLTEHGFQMKKIEENTKPYNFNCYDRCRQLST